jgi:hypothetical protein
MNRIVFSTVSVAALAATIAAQSGGTMNNDNHAGTTANMAKMAADATYTGCLQPGSTAGTFVLSGAHQMMKHSMPDGTKAGDRMTHDTMAMATLPLTAKLIDLSKHVGRKVSVTGSSASSGKDAMSKDESTLTVKTLKVVAASCS